MNLLVDTNVLIDHLRGFSLATDFLRRSRRQGRLWLSVISLAELYAGQKTRQPQEVTKIKRVLRLFRIAYIDSNIARQSGALTRDFGIAFPDALIAATALQKRLPLATRNTKDFANVPNLNLHLPY